MCQLTRSFFCRKMATKRRFSHATLSEEFPISLDFFGFIHKKFLKSDLDLASNFCPETNFEQPSVDDIV